MSRSPTAGRFFNLQPIKVTVPAWRRGNEHYHHDGEEWIYLLSGALTLSLAGKTYDLAPGDAAHFDSRLPHRLIAAGAGRCGGFAGGFARVRSGAGDTSGSQPASRDTRVGPAGFQAAKQNGRHHETAPDQEPFSKTKTKIPTAERICHEQTKPNCLNFIELLAQNIALISPTMTAALIVPLMFGTTGNISWLSYAVGTVMLLFVAFNLNQFAKRTTNSGSMYTYASSGLGFSGGALCGWCLVWAYLFIGLAGTTGFTIFAGKLLGMIP